MASLWGKLRTGLDMAQVCITAIEVIGDMVKNKPSLDTLDLIGGIVDQVKDVLAGKLDPSKVNVELKKMREDIATNNADVDAKIDEKFGTGTDV